MILATLGALAWYACFFSVAWMTGKYIETR